MSRENVDCDDNLRKMWGEVLICSQINKRQENVQDNKQVMVKQIKIRYNIVRKHIR